MVDPAVPESGHATSANDPKQPVVSLPSGRSESLAVGRHFERSSLPRTSQAYALPGQAALSLKTAQITAPCQLAFRLYIYKLINVYI